MNIYSKAKCLIPALKTIHKLSNNDKNISDCKIMKQTIIKWTIMMKKFEECLEPCEILEYHGNYYKSRNWSNGTHKITMTVFFNTYDVSVRQIDTAAMAKIVKDLILLVIEYLIIQFVP